MFSAITLWFPITFRLSANVIKQLRKIVVLRVLNRLVIDCRFIASNRSTINRGSNQLHKGPCGLWIRLHPNLVMLNHRSWFHYNLIHSQLRPNLNEIMPLIINLDFIARFDTSPTGTCQLICWVIVDGLMISHNGTGPNVYVMILHQ